MRVYIQIPDVLIATLQDQARAAHRPPRFHLEWLIQQVLAVPVEDGALREPTPKEASAVAGSELVGAVGESHAEQ